MKKKMMLTVLVLAFAVLAGLVLAYIDEGEPAKAPGNSALSVAAPEPSVPGPPPESSTQPPPESAAESAPAPAGFVLGAHEGWLAVFSADSDSPLRIYDVLVKALPEYDRARLERGIAAADEAALELLLEDYIS